MSRSSQRLAGLIASPSASSSRAVARRGITTSSTSQASAEPSSSSNTARDVRPAPPAKEGVKPYAPFTYKPTKAPQKLPSPFDPSLVHARTHGHHVCTLHLSCYGVSNNVENLDFYTDFALRAAYALGMPCSRPASLPVRTSLYTVPRSPFVHKESQENFTRSTHARVLKVFDSSPETVERWLHWCRIHAMGGLTMRADIYRHYPLTLGAQMASSAQAQLAPPKVQRSNAIAHPKTAQASRTTVQESADTVRAIAEDLKVDLERADAEGAAALEGERKSVEAAAESKEAQKEETKPAEDKSKVPAAQEAASTAQPSAAVASESSKGVSTGPAVDATPAPAAQATSTSASAEVKKSDVAAPAPATPSADAKESKAAAPAESMSAPAAAEETNVNAKSSEATQSESKSEAKPVAESKEAAPTAEVVKASDGEVPAGEKEQKEEDASTTKKEDKA